MADPNKKGKNPSICELRKHPSICKIGCNVLGSECAVVHQEQVNIAGVLDEERLVTGRHHVAGLLVGAVSNLKIHPIPRQRLFHHHCHDHQQINCPHRQKQAGLSYRGHGSLSLKTSPHTVVDTLGLPPCCIDTLVTVALVAV